MKTVDIADASTHLAALLADVEQGENVLIARDGAPVARLVRVTTDPKRQRGELRNFPGWENFKFDPSIFAPMTDENLKEEGWK